MILGKNIQCTGCGLCEVVCPKNTLKIKKSSEGFYKSFQVNDNCNECGLCERICPVYQTNEFNRPKSFVSAYSKNPETRKSCSSGGIAHEIGTLMLSKGYEVCGVIYENDKEMALHTISNNYKDLEDIKGSKYIQSYTPDAFKQIVNKIKNSKYLIFGTPCQIAAINHYSELVNKRNHLILVDFLCHGTPSYLLWQGYMRYLTQKKKLYIIKNVRFRDKKYGWHNYTMAIETKNGIYYSDRNRDKDFFYEFFLGNFCLNEACYNCDFRAINSYADIRLGDLWGTKYKEDKKGVSGVITFTDTGENILSLLKESCVIQEENLETVLEGQIKGEICVPRSRDSIIKDLRNNRELAYIYYRRLVPLKLRRKIKLLFNSLLEG